MTLPDKQQQLVQVFNKPFEIIDKCLYDVVSIQYPNCQQIRFSAISEYLPMSVVGQDISSATYLVVCITAIDKDSCRVTIRLRDLSSLDSSYAAKVQEEYNNLVGFVQPIP